jgi:hypothetical protein
VQRLKSALWLSIGKIVDEETIKLGVNATPQFIGALTEMVWSQIGTYTSWHLSYDMIWTVPGLRSVSNGLCSGRVADGSTETASQDLESFAK